MHTYHIASGLDKKHVKAIVSTDADVQCVCMGDWPGKFTTILIKFYTVDIAAILSHELTKQRNASRKTEGA